MRAIDDHDDLVKLCGGDTLCRWAAQGLAGRGRAWTSDDGRAVAVAGPGLSRRDRLAVRGPAEAVVPLLRELLPRIGRTYRPLGAPDLIEAVVAGVPGLVRGREFGWMETTAPAGTVAGRAARWLPDTALPEAAALLANAHPDSDAKPGIPGVERWAGIRDGDGRLVALAALAWSAPSVGLLAGVAVRPDAQGRGLGRAVCGFVLTEGLSRHGAVALMVDSWNDPARRLYRSLGMRHRSLLAAMTA